MDKQQQQQSGHQALEQALSTQALRNESAAIRAEAAARGVPVLAIERERFVAHEAAAASDAARVNALLSDPTTLSALREQWRSGQPARAGSQPEGTPNEPVKAQDMGPYLRLQRWWRYVDSHPFYESVRDDPPDWYLG